MYLLFFLFKFVKTISIIISSTVLFIIDIYVYCLKCLQPDEAMLFKSHPFYTTSF